MMFNLMFQYIFIFWLKPSDILNIFQPKNQNHSLYNTFIRVVCVYICVVVCVFVVGVHVCCEKQKGKMYFHEW